MCCAHVQQSRDAGQGGRHAGRTSWQPPGEDLATKAERAGNLGDGQPLAIPAVADPGEVIRVAPRAHPAKSWPRSSCRVAPTG
jgi:hypothetical protein